MVGIQTNMHTTIDPKIITKVEELLTRQINNENPYLDEQPVVLQGQKAYPVLFEPIKYIKLSRSTYKVTSFLDFTPYIRTFNSFENYLNSLTEDLNDYNKVGALKYLQERHAHRGEILNKDDMFVRIVMAPNKNCSSNIQKECEKRKKCDPVYYKAYLTVCDIRWKFRKLASITEHIREDFGKTKQHFYEAIDHIKEKPEQTEEEREKRDAETQEEIDRVTKIIRDKPSPEDIRLIDYIMNKIAEYSPEMHEHIEKNLSRQKRFGVMTWVMGWGVWSNAKNIKKIKENIEKLQEQNILQEKQIMELAHYLNLTATHVQLQDKLIEEIQTEVNFNLISMHIRLDFHIHVSNLLQDITSTVNRLLIGLIAIRNNVEKIYEYMRVMSTHKVHPALIPPQPLRDLLVHVRDKMRENPRLELPYDPDEEIWEYNEIMKITPMIVKDLMVILLTIPITDKSLSMNVYTAHNLPAVHPEHGLAARYHLEGEYLAVGKHGLYVAIPDARDIHLCLASQGGLCVMNQALHPVETIEWCIYVLFIQDEDRIKKHCIMDFKDRKANLAESLGGYMWAVSSLVGEKIQIRCLTETHVQEIRPPLQVIHVGNGCEGYSPSIMIPARSELTSQYQIAERTTYFPEFNEQYESVYNIGPWALLPFDEMPKEMLEKVIKRLPELPPMTYEHLNKRIKLIDQKYPFSVPIPVLFACQLVGFSLLILSLIGVCWKIYHIRKELRETAKMILKRGLRGKDSQKLMTTLLDLYSGLPWKAIEPAPSTSKGQVTQGKPETKLTITPCEEEQEPTPENPIGEVVMQVLKSGTEVKKLGKYYEKKQQQV